MALDQNALRDLVAQLKLIDVPDRIRAITAALYQELIGVEAASVMGARQVRTQPTGWPALTYPWDDLI